MILAYFTRFVKPNLKKKSGVSLLTFSAIGIHSRKIYAIFS